MKLSSVGVTFTANLNEGQSLYLRRSANARTANTEPNIKLCPFWRYSFFNRVFGGCYVLKKYIGPGSVTISTSLGEKIAVVSLRKDERIYYKPDSLLGFFGGSFVGNRWNFSVMSIAMGNIFYPTFQGPGKIFIKAIGEDCGLIEAGDGKKVPSHRKLLIEENSVLTLSAKSGANVFLGDIFIEVNQGKVLYDSDPTGTGDNIWESTYKRLWKWD
jgi:hypothetical protein